MRKIDDITVSVLQEYYLLREIVQSHRLIQDYVGIYTVFLSQNVCEQF